MMRKFFSCLFAAIYAIVSFSEEAPTDWYVPNGWETPVTVGDVLIGARKEKHDVILDNGKILWVDGKPTSMTAAEEDAVRALTAAWQAQEEVKQLATTIFTSAIVDIKAETSEGKTTLKWYTQQGQNSGTGGGTARGSASLRTYTVEVDEDGVYQLKEDGTAKGSAWASLFADDKSLESYNDGSIYKTRLKGWNTHDLGSAFKIAEVLTADTEDTKSRVLVYNGGTLQYWSLGKLSGGAANVDGASIVTNETTDGSASIKGFADAEMEQLPYTDGESMRWTSGGEDGALLSRGSLIPGAIGWTSTQGDNRYYGTGDNGSPLGWHNLPNVSTNYVEADEESLTAVIDGGKKTFKIKGIDSSQIYGRSGDAWVPIPGASTNGAVVKTDGVSVDTNGTDSALQIAGFKDKLGTGFLTKFGGKVISASMGFTNGLTRTETADGDYNRNIDVGLENWDTPSGTCSENLGGILTGQITEDENSHLVLTRKSDGSMHYMKVGSITNAIPKAGSAIAFYGNDGSATSRATAIIVGSGSSTNYVGFASADDSNVKVTCASDGNGGVTVTIGVYYK